MPRDPGPNLAIDPFLNPDLPARIGRSQPRGGGCGAVFGARASRYQAPEGSQPLSFRDGSATLKQPRSTGANLESIWGVLPFFPFHLSAQNPFIRYAPLPPNLTHGLANHSHTSLARAQTGQATTEQTHLHIQNPDATMADRTIIQASAVFPVVPLTTTFTAPGTACSGIYFPTSLQNIAMFHDEPSCLPSGFSTAQSAFFSPGIICPSGYYSACHDTAGIASVTTVTCCPSLADRGIKFTCVDPKTLGGVFTSKFCSWQAPASPGLPVSVTRSDTSRRTSTIVDNMVSPGGINAFGIRMVHQATDLQVLSTATSLRGSSGSSSTAGVTGPGPVQSGLTEGQTSGGSSSGLSQGATIGIGVGVAVLVLAALAGLFLWWRKRRRAAAAGAPLPASPQAEALMPENKYHYSGHPQNPHIYDAKGGWVPAPASELSNAGVAEMPGQTYVVELPTERPQR